MYIINSYPLAIFFCVITMLCWGSWGNTQKLASKSWRFELFYWDYVIGIFLFSIIVGLTLGSYGEHGRSFFADLSQVESGNIRNALIGGAVFNAANILLSASISLAGMSVAFPLGIGIALVLGAVVNYISAPKGDPIMLFAGVIMILIAVICNGVASGKMSRSGNATAGSRKGVVLALLAGLLMSFFFRFVAAAMDLDNFESPTPGKATPYTAFFIFAVGLVLSNIVFNTIIMRKPFFGAPVSYADYFKGNFKTHLVGIIGGVIWGVGSVLSYMSAGKAGAAISYALGQGATLVAALWGVFIWKEFKGASRSVDVLLGFMFMLFVAGLALIIISGAA